MADRNLLFSFLSKTDGFDLTRPADQLEDVADKARDTEQAVGRLGQVDPGLDRLERDAKDAGDSLELIGDDAKAAASKVDSAMDAIAASSKRGVARVDDDAHRAGRSLKEMGDEGQGTAREMAASFDGTADGIADGFQEAATNVLAVLGPLGAGVGVAAGVAIGALRAQSEKLKETVSKLVGELIDAGGRMRTDNVLDQLRTMAEDGSITDLADQAKRAGLPVSDFLRAVAGDPEAIARTRTEIQRLQDANQAAADGSWNQTDTLNTLTSRLDETSTAYQLAQDAASAYASAIPPGVVAMEAFTGAVEDFTSPAGVYADLLSEKEQKERDTAAATAAATKSQTDSWEDYVKDAKVSVSEYNDALEDQVVAQEQWAANMATLAKRGVSEGVLAELARMGPEAAPLVAGLATATDAELAKLDGLMQRRAEAGVASFEGALSAGAPAATAQGRRLGGAVDDGVAGGIAAGKEGITGSLNTAVSGAAAAVNGRHKVNVPVIADTSNLLPAALAAARHAQAVISEIQWLK